MNYIKVQDNVPTVLREMPGAVIDIPSELVSKINVDDYFNLSGLDYSIRFDSLKNNLSTILEADDSLDILTTNWGGRKPKGNFIFGSNLQLGFDDSRILLNSGYSLSFLNKNKWTNLQHISELDTFAYDITSDEKFLDYLPLDTSLAISQYESFFNFSNKFILI